MLTLKNLDDYRVWPVKHRHWLFEVAEDDAHQLWVRTRDLRAFWEHFPADRVLKSSHASALLYAGDSKQHYITHRAMVLLLQRSKSHSFHPEVLKFIDWFDRNVVRVAQSKRTGLHLAETNRHREQQAQQIHLGPVRPGLASPQMEESTLALSPQERWAQSQQDPALPRVFHAEARVLRTPWGVWLRRCPGALARGLAAGWRGEANPWLTFVCAAGLGAVPAALLAAVVPDAPDDWPAAFSLLLWGHMVVAVLSVLSAAAILVVTTRCTRRCMGMLLGRWLALALYATTLACLPTVAVGNFDLDLAATWWSSVRGEQQPAQVVADPHLGRVVLRGPLRFGTAEALQDALDRNPQLRLVELDSPGGYALEGFRIAQIISRRGLDTVAFGECASACTVLFAAGQVRYLGPDAVLGFHRSGTRYRPVGAGRNATDLALARYYLQRGVQPDFVDLALAPSFAELWVAPHAVQLAAGFASLRWSERTVAY